MAILTVKPDTVHRDWDDVQKFRGIFEPYTYDGDPVTYDLTHRIKWAPVAAAAGAGAMLDPLHAYLAIRNMGSDPVLLNFNTQANAPNPDFEVTILPGHWVEYVDLWMLVQPSIRVDSALYSSPVECEVLQCGIWTPLEKFPEFYCDMWAVGHIPQDGCLTKHHPEWPLAWDAVANPITDVDHWLADVAGVAIDDYWAVGYSLTEETPTNGLFAFWNGTAWAEDDVESDPPMYGVWGFATDNYWAVGGLGGAPGEIWHYTVPGPDWVTDCIPEDPEGTRTFRCVHGDIHTNIIAAGDTGLICRYNGAVWSVHPPIVEEPEVNFYGTWVSPTPNHYVCGGIGAGSEWWGGSGGTGWIFIEGPPFSENWQSYILPPGTPTLRAMWGFSDNDIWAVGDQGTILHYPGWPGNWTVVPEPAGLNGNYDYRGVFGCYPWGVWAVGTSGAGTNVIIHWDGIQWAIDDGPDIGEGDLLGLKGVWYGEIPV